MNKKFSKSDDGFSSQVVETYRLSVNINSKTADQLRRQRPKQEHQLHRDGAKSGSGASLLGERASGGHTIQIVDSDNNQETILL